MLEVRKAWIVLQDPGNSNIVRLSRLLDGCLTTAQTTMLIKILYGFHMILFAVKLIVSAVQPSGRLVRSQLTTLQWPLAPA